MQPCAIRRRLKVYTRQALIKALASFLYKTSSNIVHPSIGSGQARLRMRDERWFVLSRLYVYDKHI
jgi:hypothetical protein